MAEPAKYYTAAALAEKWNCCVQLVYNEMNSGKLGYIRIGKNYRIPPEKVEEYEAQRSSWQSKPESSEDDINGTDDTTLSNVPTAPGMSIGQKAQFLRATQRGSRVNNWPNST